MEVRNPTARKIATAKERAKAKVQLPAKEKVKERVKAKEKVKEKAKAKVSPSYTISRMRRFARTCGPTRVEKASPHHMLI